MLVKFIIFCGRRNITRPNYEKQKTLHENRREDEELIWVKTRTLIEVFPNKTLCKKTFRHEKICWEGRSLNNNCSTDRGQYRSVKLLPQHSSPGVSTRQYWYRLSAEGAFDTRNVSCQVLYKEIHSAVLFEKRSILQSNFDFDTFVLLTGESNDEELNSSLYYSFAILNPET